MKGLVIPIEGLARVLEAWAADTGETALWIGETDPNPGDGLLVFVAKLVDRGTDH